MFYIMISNEIISDYNTYISRKICIHGKILLLQIDRWYTNCVLCAQISYNSFIISRSVPARWRNRMNIIWSNRWYSMYLIEDNLMMESYIWQRLMLNMEWQDNEEHSSHRVAGVCYMECKIFCIIAKSWKIKPKHETC